MFVALLDPAEVTGGLVDSDDADPDEVCDDPAARLGAGLSDLPAYAPPGRRTFRERLAGATAVRLVPDTNGRREWRAFPVAEILCRHLEHRPAPETPETAGELGRSAPTTPPDVLVSRAFHAEGRIDVPRRRPSR